MHVLELIHKMFHGGSTKGGSNGEVKALAKRPEGLGPLEALKWLHDIHLKHLAAQAAASSSSKRSRDKNPTLKSSRKMQSLKDLHTFEGVSAFKDKPALKGVSTLKGKKLRTQVKAEASVKDTQHKVSIERAGVHNTAWYLTGNTQDP